MPSSTSEKICGICGDDCASRPRIKDKSGRYYCKACHDEALSKKHNGGTARAASSVSIGATTKSVEDVDDGALLMKLLEEQAAAAPTIQSARLCAHCHAPLALEAVVCVNCGFNARSGRQVEVKKLDRPPLPVDPAASSWPLVLGIISILLGAPGVVFGGIGLFNVFSSDILSKAPSAFIAFLAVAAGAFPFLMSTWLALAGWGTLKQSEAGFRLLRRWSITTTLLCLLLGGLFTLAYLGAMSNQRAAAQMEKVTAGATLATFWIIIGVAMIWPCFVMFWTLRPSVCAEVEKW